jgi:RNA polymerase sigma factor (sigma-70 family)
VASEAFTVIYSYVKEYILAKEGGRTPPAKLKKMRDSVFGELCRYYKTYLAIQASKMTTVSVKRESLLESEDLIQSGMLGILEALESAYDSSPDSFDFYTKQYIQGTMWHSIRDFVGRGAYATGAEWSRDIPETPHFQGFDTEELRGILAASLDVLDEREYTAVGLCIYGDMPEKEAAVLMGTSRQTVNRIKASALKKIEAYLRETHGEEVINDLRESAIQEGFK